MTQARLLPVYLIDTCSLTGLDGLHEGNPTQPRPPMFPSATRLRVWKELECLAKDGGLKLIAQVKEELKKWNPEALARLAAYPKHRASPRTQRLYATFRTIFADPENRRLIGDTRQEKADGWLCATAKLHNYTIITEELPRHLRKQKRRMKIPDVCIREHINWKSLREVAAENGWA